MALSNAEKQRRYRERKKQRDPNWNDREAKRVKKYYVPIEQRSESKQKTRRERVRLAMRKSRQKRINVDTITQANTTAGPSCSTPMDVSTNYYSTVRVNMRVNMPHAKCSPAYSRLFLCKSLLIF